MSASALTPTRLLFTVSDYYRMAEAGIFNQDSRVELIEGEVVTMSPIGSRHAACVERIGALLKALLPAGTMARTQNPVRLSNYSEPQPDVSVVEARADFYDAAHPGHENVLFCVEVADASLMYDRNTKLPLYARSGIGEVWLVDLVANVIDVHSSPAAGIFTQKQRYERGSTVVSVTFPQLRIPVSEILLG
jgi:Uma2 family endonuclease